MEYIPTRTYKPLTEFTPEEIKIYRDRLEYEIKEVETEILNLDEQIANDIDEHGNLIRWPNAANQVCCVDHWNRLKDEEEGFERDLSRQNQFQEYEVYTFQSHTPQLLTGE